MKPTRRHGAVDFSIPPERGGPDFWETVLADALKEAGMTRDDDFYLRLVVTEILPEDVPERKSP